MTISRVKPDGWLDGQTFTASQANAMDVNLTYAVDGKTTTSAGLTIATRTITRQIRGPWQPSPSTEWTFDAYGIATCQVDTTAYLVAPVSVPNGCDIKTFTVYIDPAADHAALPRDMPVAYLLKLGPSGTPAPAAVASAADTSATVEEYEALHTLTPESFTETVDNTTTRYTLAVFSEGGTSAKHFMQVLGATVQFTTSRLDEAGA